MHKHPLHNYFRRKFNLKKRGHKNTKKGDIKYIPHFVIFGILIFSFLFILIPTIIGVWALVDFEIKHNDKFYPGVFVASEPVGGLTYIEAFNHFKEKADTLQEDGLNISFEGLKGVRNVNIPTSTTGFTSDNSTEYYVINGWENDLIKAYKWGHNENKFLRIKERFLLLFTKKNFNFSNIINKTAINSLIENELYGFFKETIPAEFSSSNNKITIKKEEVGENINKEEIINIIEKKITQLEIKPETFKANIDIPLIKKENLEPFLDFAEALTKDSNLIFQYKKYNWKINGSKLVTWLTVKEYGEIGINKKTLEKYFSGTIAKFIESPPKNSRFEMQNNKLTEVVSGKSGNVIDTEDALQKIEKIISEKYTDLYSRIGTIKLPLKIIQVEPKVTKLTVEKYRIRDLVGEVRTNFKGSSSDREHNIKIGVAKITGVLIAPGEEFSTVSSIGKVTEKEGYVKEMVIKENKTTKEYGGGLCQIATTLFRLALNSGLPITERMNHRFVVHYYDPPGLDATIYGPHPDLRFVNDTDSYLLLQARVENKQVIMELYGQKDGRSVEISKANLYNRIPAPKTKYAESEEYPIGTTKCFEAAIDGITANVSYTINYPDGTTNKRNFLSVYKPWQKICLIGTAF